MELCRHVSRLLEDCVLEGRVGDRLSGEDLSANGEGDGDGLEDGDVARELVEYLFTFMPVCLVLDLFIYLALAAAMSGEDGDMGDVACVTIMAGMVPVAVGCLGNGIA